MGERQDSDDDARWMRAALTLAGRGRGRVAPNPAVAALIVQRGRLIARGLTAPGGRPHAEAVALADAAARGETVAGATVYVTLEPCAHHGRTPPCADALAAAGVARVVCPLQDPDPRVCGRGFARLAAAGITVTVGVLEAEARAVNAGFLSMITRARPRLVLKLATTLDGRIATRTGESRWITGPHARARVHAMRARADAVMVGAGTARADDPMLDVRGMGRSVGQPARVVVDPRLTLPPDSRLATSATRQPVWLAHAPGEPQDAPADWRARQAALAARGVRFLPVPPAPPAGAAVPDGPSSFGGRHHPGDPPSETGAPPGATDIRDRPDAGTPGADPALPRQATSTPARRPGDHRRRGDAGRHAMPGPGDSAHAFHGQPRRDREDRPRPDGTGAFSGDTWLDPTALVDALGRTGATEVLCEGGAGLAAGLLRAGLVDELVLFSAGAVIGADGRAGVDPIGLDLLGDAPRFTLTALDRIGDDAVGVWHPATVPP